MKNRRVAVSDAASGMAMSRPAEPDGSQKASSANVSQTGLSLTRAADDAQRQDVIGDRNAQQEYTEHGTARGVQSGRSFR